MKVRYFKDTDTLLIEFRDAAVAETRDLIENTVLDLDAKGNICSSYVETARCIEVYATLQSANPSGGMVHLSVCPFGEYVGQRWLVDWEPDAIRDSGQKLRFNDKFLAACNEPTP